MDGDSPRRSVDALLGHARFVRGLARALLSDDARAADLEQDAWVAALERRPSTAGRGWFAAVLRNLRAKALRGRERAQRRERAVARAEAQPAASEIVAREETLRGVMEAVLALDPVHREVVLLRFYEDLPPREIAARLVIPVNTVRSRLGRALADLRARLDARHGGRREAWALSLGWLAGGADEGGGAGAAAAAAGVIMATKAKAGIAAALLLLAGGTGWWMTRGDGEPPATPGTGTVASTGARPAAGQAPPTAPVPPTAVPAASTAPAGRPGPSPEEGKSEVAAAVIVEGVVVDGDDRPVAEAEVTLLSPDPETRAYRPARAATAEDGKFRFTMRDRYGSLFATKPGWAHAVPVDLDAAPGSTRSVRLILPGPEGVIEGVVLGPDGNPLPGVTVRVGPPDELLLGKPGGNLARSPEVETDGAGRFRVGGLRSGSTEVMARTHSLPPQMRQVPVEPGKTSRVEIRFTPPATLAGTVRYADGSPAAGVTIRLVSFLGAPQGARTDGEGKYRIEGLGHGEVEAWVDGKERGHARAVLTTEAEGETRWDPVLSIEPTIRGRLLDDAGRPIEGWWVEAVQGERDFEWAPGAILKSRTGADGSFLLQNLIAKSFSVWARKEERGVPSVIREGVPAGGGPVDIRVPADDFPTAGVRGVLRNADGSTPARASVQLWAGPERGAPFVAPRVEFDAATGAFSAADLPEGRYGISVWSKEEGGHFLPAVDIPPGKTVDLGEVVLTAPGRIAVTLAGSIPGDPGTQVLLTIHARTPEGGWRPAGPHELVRGAAAPDLLLGDGEYRVRLWGNWVTAWERVVRVASGGEVRLEVPIRRAPQRFLRATGPGLPPQARWIHSRILDADGLVHQDTKWGRARGQPDIIGYAFLEPGTWHLELAPDGREPVRRTVTIAGDEGGTYQAAIPIEFP